MSTAVDEAMSSSEFIASEKSATEPLMMNPQSFRANNPTFAASDKYVIRRSAIDPS
jgi:hypothetical protein